MDIARLASKAISLLTALSLAMIMTNAAALAGGVQLKNYKNRMFAYRKPLESADNGDFLMLPYDPLKDINKRDVIPVRKVNSMYVSLRPKRHQQDLFVEANGRKVTYFAVGALKGNAKFTVIFLHGRDGTRDLGFDDDRFGGNFNRAKNLAYRNGGIYISTDFTEIEENGQVNDNKLEMARQDVAAVIEKYRPLTNGPIILACGSMGSFVCWSLMNNPESAAAVDGLLVMGGFPNPGFVKGGAPSAGIGNKPVYIAHGEIDYVYKWQDQHRFYKTLRAQGTPARLVVFKGGKHGTPVRMVDWRLALNWIIANQSR